MAEIGSITVDVLSEQLTGRVKQHLRQRLRATRRAYPLAVIQEKSRALCERLLGLPELAGARGVALYAAIGAQREVDLSALDVALRARGVALYYPFMDPTPRGYRTGFRRLEGDAELSAQGQSFVEPPRSAPEAQRGDIDVVLVPALAAEPGGYRLGYGSGFYDVTLPDVAPPAKTIVTVFDFQLLAELPTEAHDQPCDWIVTERRTLSPAR